MAIQGILAVIETIMYFVVGITGLVAAVTVGISRNAFSGECILYSKITWCNETAMGFTELGSHTSCSFAVVVQCVASFYAIAFGVYYILILLNKIEGLKFLTLPSIVINVAFALLLFVESCVVSVGFKQFCSGLTSSPGTVSDCSKGSSVKNWNIQTPCADPSLVYKEHPSYSGSSYFGFFTTAQSASWFSVLFWVIIAIISIIRRVRDKPTLDPGSDKAPISPNVVI
ncbi:transmembrane protein 179-like [Diadema setosum]|uniref:transmembrane protein 179-like n=1 Tax=Diadema setosum TaxID=31175 RepID=UPI003B3A5F9D